jgi:hypothetical protein
VQAAVEVVATGTPRSITCMRVMNWRDMWNILQYFLPYLVSYSIISGSDQSSTAWKAEYGQLARGSHNTLAECEGDQIEKERVCPERAICPVNYIH